MVSFLLLVVEKDGKNSVLDVVAIAFRLRSTSNSHLRSLVSGVADEVVR